MSNTNGAGPSQGVRAPTGGSELNGVKSVGAKKHIGDVVLDVKNISLSFGGVKALTDISFNVREHEVRAIIGPNGAGKSSMLNCINGVYTPQQGSITFRGQTFSHMDSHQVAVMGIGRTFQNLALFKGMSVIDKAICCGRRCASARPSARKSGTASLSSTSLTSWKSRHSARPRSASCPMACKSAWTWGAPWRWSRRSCCWTNRWPA
jgi:ABC-type transporter Mla maintaining outer membrane lipid asymmetry ATPase subunit MlaF